MSQITLYLDPQTEAHMRQSAQAAGLSLSLWLRQLIQAQLQNQWPADIAAMAGTWQDAPEPEMLRQSMALDAPREDW